MIRTLTYRFHLWQRLHRLRKEWPAPPTPHHRRRLGRLLAALLGVTVLLALGLAGRSPQIVVGTPAPTHVTITIPVERLEPWVLPTRAPQPTMHPVYRELPD